jgi:hypothetical protein
MERRPPKKASNRVGYANNIDPRLRLSADNQSEAHLGPCPYRKSNPGILVVQSFKDRTQRMFPARWTTRESGASLFKDKCVRVAL